MSGGLESVAKSWLQEESWQKVFKHTFDVVEDYVTYILITIGAIALSIRLLTTLGTGDVQCFLLMVNASAYNGTEDLGPYPSGGTLGFVNYAQVSQSCSVAVFNKFWDYLPYIMLLQTLFLVVVEKFTFKIPRIAQKVERFYRNIIDEALFGKDPDVAEDLSDPKSSIEAISRMRQRNEICIVLKRSNLIYTVYLLKNVVEVVFAMFVFTPLNLFYGIHSGLKNDEGLCRVSLLDVPGTDLDGGEALFQLVNEDDGRDFLFLFDLLAHTCGIESTLRVLTHSENQFYDIFKPNLHPTQHLNVEEDRLRVSWYPSDVERWSMDHKDKLTAEVRKLIHIESYEVTIFPAERFNNTQSVGVALGSRLVGSKEEIAPLVGGGNDPYTCTFHDLNGGKTEYVVTIACMIGKSRMKGAKVVTNLVPYGPVLESDDSGAGSEEEGGPGRRRRAQVKENLNSQLTSYTITGLEPGEKYVLELGTKTGNVPTNRPVSDYFVTRPLPPCTLTTDELSPTSCHLKWKAPDKNSCIRGFQIKVASVPDKRVVWERSVMKHVKQFVVEGLAPGTDYDVSFTSVASEASDKRRTESEPGELEVTTMLEKVRDLRLEEATETALTLKWDPVKVVSTQTYRLEIRLAAVADGSEDDFHRTVDVAGDLKEQVLTDLSPGKPYTVAITTLAKTPSRDNETSSHPVKNVFLTRPIAPTALKASADGSSLQFVPSSTVNGHIVTWRELRREEGDTAEGSPSTSPPHSRLIPPSNSVFEAVSVLSPSNTSSLSEGSAYLVTLYATTSFGQLKSESEPLQETFLFNNEKSWQKLNTDQDGSGEMSKQTSRQTSKQET